MKTKKRFFNIAACLLILLLLSACSREQESAPPENVVYGADLQGNGGGELYGNRKVAIDEPDVSIRQAVETGDEIVIYGYDNREQAFFYKMNFGELVPEKLNFNICGEVVDITAGSDGSLIVLMISEDGEYVLSFFRNGIKQEDIILSKTEALEENIITKVYAAKDHFIILTTNEILLFDSDGVFVKSIGDYFGIIACMYTDDNEVLIAKAEHNQNTKLSVLDENFDVKKTYTFQNQYTGFYRDGENNGSILALSGDILFRLNYMTGEREALVDTFASSMYTNNLICLPNEQYLTIYHGDVLIWEKATEEKIRVKLATYERSYQLQSLLSEYNRSNRRYKIDVIDYSIYNETDKDESGLNKLKTDIITGNTPDIFDLSNLPAEMYAAKNLLEDLTPYFGNRIEVDCADLVQSAAETLKYKGKLYYIAPSFDIYAVCGDKSFVGTTGEWNVKDFLEAMSGYESERAFGPNMTKTEFLRYVIMFQSDYYVDKDNAKCNFDEEGFVELLQFASQLPENGKKDMGSFWAHAYVGNQLLLDSFYGSSAVTWMSFADAIFNGEAQFVGFPSNCGSGTAMCPNVLLGISAASDKKAAALDFLNFVLGDAAQNDTMLTSGFPFVQAALEKRVDLWGEIYKEELQKGGPGLYSPLSSVEDVYIKGETDPELAKKRVLALVEKVDSLYFFDEQLFDIVLTEAQAYFYGKNTIEKTIENIQSRATIYVSEQFGS